MAKKRNEVFYGYLKFDVVECEFSLETRKECKVNQYMVSRYSMYDELANEFVSKFESKIIKHGRAYNMTLICNMFDSMTFRCNECKSLFHKSLKRNLADDNEDRNYCKACCTLVSSRRKKAKMRAEVEKKRIDKIKHYVKHTDEGKVKLAGVEVIKINLKIILGKRNMTLSKLGRELGYSSISRFFSELNSTSTACCNKICRHLNITIEQLTKLPAGFNKTDVEKGKKLPDRLLYKRVTKLPYLAMEKKEMEKKAAMDVAQEIKDDVSELTKNKDTTRFTMW